MEFNPFAQRGGFPPPMSQMPAPPMNFPPNFMFNQQFSQPFSTPPFPQQFIPSQSFNNIPMMGSFPHPFLPNPSLLPPPMPSLPIEEEGPQDTKENRPIISKSAFSLLSCESEFAPSSRFLESYPGQLRGLPPFSEQEDYNLAHGVINFGGCQWAKILSFYHFAKGRSPQDLLQEFELLTQGKLFGDSLKKESKIVSTPCLRLQEDCNRLFEAMKLYGPYSHMFAENVHSSHPHLAREEIKEVKGNSLRSVYGFLNQSNAIEEIPEELFLKEPANMPSSPIYEDQVVKTLKKRRKNASKNKDKDETVLEEEEEKGLVLVKPRGRKGGRKSRTEKSERKEVKERKPRKKKEPKEARTRTPAEPKKRGRPKGSKNLQDRVNSEESIGKRRKLKRYEPLTDEYDDDLLDYEREDEEDDEEYRDAMEVFQKITGENDIQNATSLRSSLRHSHSREKAGRRGRDKYYEDEDLRAEGGNVGPFGSREQDDHDTAFAIEALLSLPRAVVSPTNDGPRRRTYPKPKPRHRRKHGKSEGPILVTLPLTMPALTHTIQLFPAFDDEDELSFESGTSSYDTESEDTEGGYSFVDLQNLDDD